MKNFLFSACFFLIIIGLLKHQVSGFAIKRRHSGGASLLFGQVRTKLQIDSCSGNVKLDDVPTELSALPAHFMQFFLTCHRSVCILELEANHCATGAVSETVPDIIETISGQISGLPRKPNGLILRNLPSFNAKLIRSSSRSHMKELQMETESLSEMNSALQAARRCNRLAFLGVDGPYSNSVLLETVHRKSHLAKLNIKQSSVAINPEKMSEILRAIPHLKVVNILCIDSCRTNFSRLVSETPNTFAKLTGVNFQSDSEPIDSAALKLSQTVLLKTSVALVLKGNQSIKCDNMINVARNMFVAQSAARQPFYLIILRAEHSCDNLDELWAAVAEKLEVDSLSNCLVDRSENCRSFQGREVLLSSP